MVLHSSLANSGFQVGGGRWPQHGTPNSKFKKKTIFLDTMLLNVIGELPPQPTSH